jgi:hypothetical protein
MGTAGIAPAFNGQGTRSIMSWHLFLMGGTFGLVLGAGIMAIVCLL